ncbi:UDP-glucose 4-epimerase GalE [Helicobacter mehlei]|uniref:UDP-glucose 4-epimerase n=1 Tax=Helicobacter mehlei TaxID=2316080 RepID=A0A553UWH1_9HELI|nr:UDP-glucose 4-epimerase GalE [Helicobacter mehlei]TSA84555.1 UDP-glucose 4-epimerase GalE [Helicobacter mehlei]
MLLFTGACGYIGSSVARWFLEYTPYSLLIVDNLSTGFDIHLQSLQNYAKLRKITQNYAKLRKITQNYASNRVGFVHLDLQDSPALSQLLAKYPILGVLHFAAKISVEESTRMPLSYYENNTLNTLKLAKLCTQHGIKHLLFSSSAAVYEPSDYPVNEQAPLKPINPYGASKMMAERILLDTSLAEDFSCAILRYFNVAGATHFNDYTTPFGLGQRAQNATHLIKVACECATHKRPSMQIFGNDYPTPDGTCIRDFIHIDDLALAHLQAFNTLLDTHKNAIYNVGYGRGYSVLEVIKQVKEVSGVDFKVQIAPRRVGDPSSLIADNAKILEVGFKPQFDDLKNIVSSAYEWEQYLGRQHG